MPYFRRGKGGEFAGAHFSDFAHIGGSPSEIFFTLILNPLQTFGYLTNPNDLEFYVELLGPLGFLSLLAPVVLLVPASQFLVMTLPSEQFFASIGWWYHALVIPFVWTSAIVGLSRFEWLMKTLTDRTEFPLSRLICPPILNLKSGETVFRFVIPVLLITGLLIGYGSGIFAPGKTNELLETSESTDVKAMDAALEQIPSNASVGAQWRFLPKLATRSNLQLVPGLDGEPDYIIISPNESSPFYSTPDGYSEFVGNIQSNSNYRKVFEQSGIVVYKSTSEREDR
jgi:uncharacterized membrane protein